VVPLVVDEVDVVGISDLEEKGALLLLVGWELEVEYDALDGAVAEETVVLVEVPLPELCGFWLLAKFLIKLLDLFLIYYLDV